MEQQIEQQRLMQQMKQLMATTDIDELLSSDEHFRKLLCHLLFSCAHDGDVDTVQLLVSKGVKSEAREEVCAHYISSLQAL